MYWDVCPKRFKSTGVRELRVGTWTADEDAVLDALFSELGAEWIEIAKELCGR
jgi:hypothetical protein